MLKKLCYSTFILIIFSCQEPPERHCSDFKTGEFQSVLVVKDTFRSSFVRQNDLQIEQFKASVDSFKIRWINDCEYILKKIHPKNREEEKSNHIKILTTTDSSYTFEFNTVGDSKKIRGTAFKID